MIQILDSKTINKIAAGEVIDRPVSVVKELVDNAIDAKATTIQLTIKQGGKELIQIQDNGGGIPKKELSLAPIQHATSKISKLEDLFETASLGFRGEALSSIGHVADLNITSRTKSGDSGYSIHVNDGVISDTKPIAHEIGTSVKVIEIFDNIPVRKRFLKASNTEFSYIYELVLHYAFVFPTINFVLSEIAFSNSIGSILKESSISTITGSAPNSTIVSTVATKVNACVITSSPGLIPNALIAIY